ncbi:hypothetical protein BV509_17350 [Rhodovulum sulfidophilum]|uniref:type I site-specific deoxyribonuclease n=1 Tax=Rhodovulum visakhapatnamense TaxID=364297 RepID=A0ABS1RMJ3_9RHOB|nr:type I restriction endonuclease [Rhodovulum visakhapatnamense]MBL3571851.1 hypothetical protein [Rhodovulum visakhapatnamense]MBL3580122.1 hypothetical protein [Rhodovulum visakhapatnamense]OLS45946.1 hypothetical protein BV509_17350 [Rhodovulum sulfidophilum]
MEGTKLYEANQGFYDMLRYGVAIAPGPGEAPVTVRFVDWSDAGANDLGVAEEVSIKGKDAKAWSKRPDLVLYVNGIALGVVELKKSTVGVGTGIRQTLDNQQPEFIRHFFTTVQITFAGNDSEGLRYAPIKTPQPYWLAWKEDSEISARLDRDVTQMMAPTRFLELIHDFTLFDAGIKKIARPNQYFAVKAAQERVAAREGGIIWQTQGSGKSLIMVMLARWIREAFPEAGMGETEKQRVHRVYTDLLGDTSEEEYEEEALRLFKKEPGRMKLLIVVSRLLTGFDAPTATYIYIDKQMRDHGLFQAICRVNRLDGDDKDFGYIVDYKDLFRNIESAVDDYTSEAFDAFDKEDVEGLITDRAEQADTDLRTARDAWLGLLDAVEQPKGDDELFAYFSSPEGIESDPDAEEKARRRQALYKLAGRYARAYTNVAADPTHVQMSRAC